MGLAGAMYSPLLSLGLHRGYVPLEQNAVKDKSLAATVWYLWTVHLVLQPSVVPARYGSLMHCKMSDDCSQQASNT
jgi:hypothetical protein